MQKPDRRIQRTKRLLQTALLELIIEKRYDKVTVQDILDRADVGRSTFYAHFRDKDDLLIGGLPEQIFQLHADPNRQDDDLLFISYVEVLYHAQEHHELFKALLGSEGIEVIKRNVLYSLKQGIAQRLLLTIESVSSEQQEIITNYLAGGVMTCIMWWLDNDMSHSPEELDASLQKLMMNSLSAFAT